MYFNFLGGSALLHLLAAHPKVVAVFGIVASVSLLATPLGPQNYFGTGRYVRALEQTLKTHEVVGDAAVAQAAAETRRLATESGPDIEAAIRRVLEDCGRGCADLTPAIVMNDEGLRRAALSLSVLNRAALAQDPGDRRRIAQQMSRR
jgi:hypothetical protein